MTVPRRGRLVAAVVLAIGLVAVSVLLVSGYLAYESLSTVVAKCGNHDDWEDNTPTDFGIGKHPRRDRFTIDPTRYRIASYETVEFPTRGSALTLRGWFAANQEGSTARAVIVVHGFDSCRRSPTVLVPAGMLHRAGFSVLLVDLRNHGDSDRDNGRWAGGDKEYQDVLGAWDYLVARGYEPGEIGLLGVSLGAATVTLATGLEPRVGATWTDSSYSDFGTASAEYAVYEGYPSWVTLTAVPIGRIVGDPALGTLDPEDAAAQLAGRPFAIVHGLDDDLVLPHHALNLAAAAGRGGTDVAPWIVPRAGHVDAMMVEPEEYETRLVAFFGQLTD